MLAMVLNAAGEKLVPEERPDPVAGPGEVVIKVLACGVCRTDLHVVDGELPETRYPIVPGHEIVGRIAALGAGVSHLKLGERVGVGWLGRACGVCPYCVAGQENLCDDPVFTGCTRDGGFATHTVADARYVYPMGEDGEDASLAPLLCAGLIGWRTLKMAGAGERIGIYGFGAAAHIIAQVARFQDRQVYAFTRPGDEAAQDFALSLGASYAGSSDMPSPEVLDSALIFAPAGELVPQALRAVRKGGCVVCGGIHMSDIPAFPYRWLWEERQIRSVANLTRADAHEFLALAPKAGITTHVTPYPLEKANAALDDLRHGRLQGAAVLVP